MYIAIANSILSSSNSGSAGPTTERYFLTSCTGQTGPCTTPDFPIGTYNVGDRLRYEYQGWWQFGIVDNITTLPSDSPIDIEFFGVNTTECIDNTLSLIPGVGFSGVTINFTYDLENNDEQFTSIDSEYAFQWGYYYRVYSEYIDQDGYPASEYVFFTDTGTLSDYDIGAGGGIQINQQNYISDASLIFFVEIDEGWSNNPIISNTYGYTQNDCSFPYFMRVSDGSTFYINFQSDC